MKVNFEVAEIEVVEPILRYTEEEYTFGVNAIVDCGEHGFVVIDDRGKVIGVGDYPETAKADAWYNIGVYLGKYAPHVGEYVIEYENEDMFSETGRINNG